MSKSITLNLDDILELLADGSNEAFRELHVSFLNSILVVESSEQIKADPYVRSEKRTDFRSGSLYKT